MWVLIALQADATTLDFEGKLRDFLLEFGETKVETQGFSFFVAVASGYADVAGEEIQVVYFCFATKKSNSEALYNNISVHLQSIQYM